MARAGLWSAMLILSLLVLPTLACSPSTPSPISPSPTAHPTPPSSLKPEEPSPSAALEESCRAIQTPSQGNFDQVGLRVGETAVDFTLRDIHGTEFRLSRLQEEKPVMMVFRSFT